MESNHYISDRYGSTYRVQSERDTGWSFHLWDGEDAVGYMHCIEQPPVLLVGDFKLRDDVRVPESVPAFVCRKLLGRPPPVCSYRGRGLGTAMFVLLSDLA